MNTHRDSEVIDRNGTRVIRNGVLQDGDRLVVKMTMMDAANTTLAVTQQLEPHQRDTYIEAVANGTPIADALARAKAIKRVEQFDARGHRPGFATRDAALSTTLEQLRDERDRRTCDAWRNPPAVLDEDKARKHAAPVAPTAPNEQLFAARDMQHRLRDERIRTAWMNND
jgi:hypothetical protein